MKVHYFIVWMGLFSVMLLSGCASSKQTAKEEKVEKEAKLLEAIENRTFIVEVDRALPTNGSSRILTSPYSLTINGDAVKSHLPFFGRAYSVPYGGGDGLMFDSTLTDYQFTFDKKGMAIIDFKTRTKEDQFTYRVQIFKNGSSSIHVTSNNRQPISFTGQCNPITPNL